MNPSTSARPRVVVTGIGVLSPLGNSTASSWQAAVAGRSGIARITHFDPTPYSSHVAGEVKGFDEAFALATTGLEAKDLKKCDRFIQLGLAATREAMAQAGLLDAKNLPKATRERMGVILGTGIGGLASVEEGCSTLAARGPRRISPFLIPAMLPNLLAGQASMQYGAQGPNVCPVSACATSAHALGWGKRLIEWGEADIIIAGGAEAAVTPVSVGGFAAMRALSSGFNEDPAAASRPFDAARDGFVIGEGAATLVLEREDHARARGAEILGVLAGFGQSGDAYHLTLPAERGEGANRAMRLALQDAGHLGFSQSDIGYINAHATSTLAGDELESAAISDLFGDKVPVSSTKSMTGHLLGGAGALEAALSLMALHEQTLPPTINLQTPSEGCRLDYVPGQARKVTGLNAILSNSFGFGGTNAALILAKA